MASGLLIGNPAYSPELNAIERLWGYLKSHYLSNRVYTGYDDLLSGLKLEESLSIALQILIYAIIIYRVNRTTRTKTRTKLAPLVLLGLSGFAA